MRNPPQRWPLLRQTFHRFELMNAMMRAIGIDEASAARLDHGQAIATAREQCLACQSTCRCARFLDELDKRTGRMSACPNFCLNVHFFERCAGKRNEKHRPRH